MAPGGHLPSDSIKEVPGRSKLRVESSNPVPRGTPTSKTSKVQMISPEEAMKLTSGGNEMAAFPVAESSKPNPSRATSQVPKPVPARQTPETPRPVPARPTTTQAPRPVLTTSAPGFRKEIICGLEALSVTTPLVTFKTNPRQRQPKTDEPTNPRHRQLKTDEPSSPRALQIRSRVKQQAPNATQVVQEPIVEVGDGAKDHGFKEIVDVGDKAKDHGYKEIFQSVSDEELWKLHDEHRPAKNPTWKGRIVDSATPLKFDCDFWAAPARSIIRKAHKLSKAMSALLKVELLPIGHIVNNASERSPSLLNVQIYLFPDEKKTERFKGDHAHLFEAIETRNVMIKADINGTELLIYSSKLLDKTSQFVVNTQKKTENFLWGIFPETIKLLELGPGTAYQIDKDLDADVVDMDIDNDCPTASVALKLIAKLQSTPSKSLEELNSSVPPGFEKKWAPPLVKLNIQGTSKMGFAGIVLNQSGKWVFGYSKCHNNISEVAAGVLAIYHGLKILWDSGFRRIRLETTSHEIITALTTKSYLFPKRKTILGSCKDMILKEWECDIYTISKEQNSCAEWLASSSRLEEQLQGFIFFEFPPRGLVGFLEKNGHAAIT